MRSLVLAGGGMRVAWQAGVVQALHESSVEFEHVDGTSGGVFTAAALLSGVQPLDLCERWASIDVQDFASLLPLRDYLGGPTNLPALGDADGIVQKVFPHLGIDVDSLRKADGPAGTFNVCNFADKTVEAWPHDEVDLDILVAGVSLPVFMPVVMRDGVPYTDAVWIKDANLLEAARRGAREIWLAWCIGNTDRWGDGPLEQYVHMIEMSANGALFWELSQLAALDEPPVVHVIHPEFPLPLDPELYAGRIAASTLVAMGYRDARRYLASMSEAGMPLDHRCTKMREPGLGARFREQMAGDGLSLDLGVEIADVSAVGEERMVGWVRSDRWGTALLADGRFSVAGEELRYEGWFLVDGRRHGLLAVKRLHDDPGFDLWEDVTTVSCRVADDTGAEAWAGTLRLDAGDVRRLVMSIEPVGAHGLGDRAAVMARLGRLLLREAFDRSGG
nr:patatin-like phospholipase family protein [Actinomycetota bacterium]